MTENIKATNWPVPVLCRHCHEQILICPVLDYTKWTEEIYVVPLAVDAWPEGEQWKSKEQGSFWERTSAYKPHVCDEAKVALVKAAERAERKEDDEEIEEEIEEENEED